MRLIAVGAFHNLALQEGGTLWAWGNNEYGQLGTWRNIFKYVEWVQVIKEGFDERS